MQRRGTGQAPTPVTAPTGLSDRAARGRAPARAAATGASMVYI